MSNLKSNFIYNIIYQILVIILPFITAPYLSRVIGAEGTGIYSYTYSVAYYFMLISMLGISNYGNRLIAKVKDNQEELNCKFSSLLYFHLIFSFIITVIYILYLIFFVKNNLNIAIIQTLFVISSLFDISWFFFGLEKFKITVTRNIIIKFFSVACIFIFVKTKENINIYTFIMAFSTFLSQVSLWTFLKKYVNLRKVKLSEIVQHFKPCCIMFIPVIAYSIYKVMDKIMLGNMSTMIEVGLYENAEKIINIPMGIITALGTVMLPKVSNLVANGKNEESLKYMNSSINFVVFMSTALILGLVAVSPTFIPFYFGKEFTKSAILVQVLSGTIICISIANVLRTQYLIPHEEDMKYIKSVCLGAIANLIFNILLIPRLNSIGAAIGTLIAEFTVMIVQIIDIKKEVSIVKYIRNALVYLSGGIIMFIVIYPFRYLNLSELVIVIMQVLIGAIIFLSISGTMFIKNNNINLIKILKLKNTKKLQ